MRGRKKKKTDKINLIPILDAIFIFIFFLLMSAQFIDIYEIGSDAPITSTSSEKMEKKPLNLTLELKDDKVIVKTGLDEKVHKTHNMDNLGALNDTLIELKKQYPDEASAILKPASNFKYKKIVKVIDHTREIVKANHYITALDKDKKKYPSKVLFERIIFDTVDN
jgi:biopolymer transport protein ExbD